MSIQSGLAARLFLDQWDLSGDVSAIGRIASTTNLQDRTVLLNAAMARLPLLRDGAIDFTGFFNGATGGAQAVLRALPGTATQATVITASTVGADTFSLTGLQAAFNDTRGQDGSLVLDTSLEASGSALEVGELLTTGSQAFASAAAGSTLTYSGASTAFGWTAYLHALSIASGTATVSVQDSADNVTFTDLAGGAFAGVSAAGAQRIAGGAADTVRKYARVNVAGTFTSLVAVVTFVRYTAAPHP